MDFPAAACVPDVSECMCPCNANCVYRAPISISPLEGLNVVCPLFVLILSELEKTLSRRMSVTEDESSYTHFGSM